MNAAAFGSLPGSACTLGTQGAYGPDRIVKYLYSAADEVTTVRAGFGTGVQQDAAVATFSDNGQQATLSDAGGNKTTFEYDGFDRLSKIRFPSPTTPGTSSTTDYEQFGYDAGSNLTSDRRRDGTSIAFAYDNLNRRTSMDLPSGGGADVSYAFDNFGRMTSAAISGHTLSFAYDQLSRVTGQTDPRGTLAYQYDIAGRRTRITHPDGFYASYDWNLADEVTAIGINGVSVVANYTHDDLGRRTRLDRSNNVDTVWSYNGASWLTGIAHDLAGAGDDQTYTFTLNPAGQIVARSRSNSAYDPPVPANATTTYTDNGLNQYTAVASATPTYDARGNITYDGQRNYTYDALNRLVTAGTGTLTWDPAGRLDSFNNGSGAQGTLWDGGDLVVDYTTTGAVARRFVHGPSLDEPVVWYDGAGTSMPSYSSADQLGSVVAWSNASGIRTQINSFDDYGAPGPSNGGRFQFTGQTWMPGAIGADLYHYKARVYSTTLGRFLQTDPIGYDGGMNL